MKKFLDENIFLFNSRKYNQISTIKKVLLDATILSHIENLHKIITELECEGNPIYLPPKYFNDTETKVYISKERNSVDFKLIVDHENSFFLGWIR